MMETLSRKYQELMEKRENGEGGFTLIELLVVMIIIGILAAIAIPIFMNQQKTARDSATTSDLKNVATNIQSVLVRYPDASYLAVVDPGTAAPAASGVAATAGGVNGKVEVIVGDSQTDNETVEVAVSKGTEFTAPAANGDGTFEIGAFNATGKSYIAAGSALVYDSAAGGLQ